MKVKLENIEAQLGNNGVMMRISDNSGKALGRLEIGRAKLLWWPGSASKNSKRIEMKDFVAWLNEQ